MLVFLLQLGLLSLLIYVPSTTASHVIFVDAKKGNDSECPGQGVEVPCMTLTRAGELIQEYEGDVQVQVHTNLTLNDVMNISNVSNFEILGSNQSLYNLTFVRCGSGNAGFILDSTHNFTILNLAVINCTANFSENSRLYKFAMFIRSSSNFLLKNVRFESCSNTALTMIDNTDQVFMDNISFIENHPNKKRAELSLSVSHPGAIGIQENLRENQTVHIKITSSVFHYNRSPHTKVWISAGNRTNFVDRGYGGAMFVEFGGNTSNSKLVIEDSKFTRNIAARGGGVYAYYKDSARNNSIRIISTEFKRNSADISGGGLNFGCNNSPSLINLFEVRNCSITSNTALFGAGLTMYTIYGIQDFSNTNSNSVFIFNNSTWRENSGSLSSAVDVGPLNKIIGEQGYLPTPRFIDCTFESNTIQIHKNLKLGKTTHSNVGVFSVTQIRVLFSKTTIFRNNSFSALLLESGIMEFEANSTVVFEDNSGFNGGAVAMYGFSMILFNINSNITFLRNHARNYGGAIFYKTSDQHTFLKGSKDCFLRNKLDPSDKGLVKTIRVRFENNTADRGGRAIFSESFYSCYIRSKEFFQSNDKFNHYSKVFRCVGNFTFSHRRPLPLTSSGNSFNFSGQSNYSYRVFPGSSLNLSFAVLDDFHQKITPLLNVVKLNPFAEVDVRDHYTLSNEVSPVGQPNATSNFTVTAIGVREIYFLFEVTLLPCPPGYHIKNETCKCASGRHGYKEITKCDDSKFHAKYKGDLYFGYIPPDSSDYMDLYFAPCVVPLCRAKSHHLPMFRTDLTRIICADHRQGVMCGECEKDYATYYHSRNFTCGPVKLCHLSGLFYALSEILPMVVFFIIIVTFDLSFTSGISVGFVFFTQYPNHLSIPISPLFAYFRAPYHVFYGLFNFEFFNLEGLSFCLWTDAQVLDILAVKYVTVVIAFGLVLAFIAMLQINSCNKLCRLRKKVSAKTSMVHGLSTFLVICYAQCTSTSFYILRYSEPVGYNGRRIGYYSYYGGLPYFKGKHLIYAIPALISLVFVTILPPLVLLLYPLTPQLLSLCGLSEHWIVNKMLQLTGINKLKPFIDCFQSCYKDKLRFFAGLYFVYRVVILLVFSISPNSVLCSIYSEIVIVLWLGIHSTVHPYKERLHNTIDSLVFFNLALINGCVIVSREWVSLLEDPSSITTDTATLLLNVFQLLLLYAPILVVLVALIRRTYIKHRGRSETMERMIEVDNIIEHDSDHSNLLHTSITCRDDSEEVSSSRTEDYGSMLDTY